MHLAQPEIAADANFPRSKDGMEKELPINYRIFKVGAFYRTQAVPHGIESPDV